VHVRLGIGANVSVRRFVFERLGTFVPLLGPGALLLAGEQFDIAIPGPTPGYEVVNAAENAVFRSVVREGADASSCAGIGLLDAARWKRLTGLGLLGGMLAGVYLRRASDD
jgi:hypothetical protein